MIAPPKVGAEAWALTGGQLLYLAVAGCISNDLFREARAAGIELSSVRVKVSGDFVGEPAVSDEIQYEVEVAGNVSEDQLRALIDQVDEIAEIPQLAPTGDARAFGRGKGASRILIQAMLDAEYISPRFPRLRGGKDRLP